LCRPASPPTRRLRHSSTNLSLRTESKAYFRLKIEEFIFPGVHHAFRFSLLTLKSSDNSQLPEFIFFARQPFQLAEPERRFTLSAEDIAHINPNTKTAPIFRSRADAELTAKIYARLPVLIDEAKGAAGNPWGLSFMALFHMANDSGLFRTAAQLREAGFERNGGDWVPSEGVRPRQGPLNIAGADRRNLPLADIVGGRDLGYYVPLYEAKMVHQFDHRWATYEGADSRDSSVAEKADPSFEPAPRYWVPEREIGDRLASRAGPAVGSWAGRKLPGSKK
jgi:hypothetical protein